MTISTRLIKKIYITLSFILLLTLLPVPLVHRSSVGATAQVAATSQEIDVSVEVALESFYSMVLGGKEYLESAKGVLVFPNVMKAGFVFGGEYGEGAMIIEDKTVDYYNISTGSIGFQFGAQARRLIIVFMEENTLNKFLDSNGWDFGIDGSAAFFDMGTGGSIDSLNLNSTIIAIVWDIKGLMIDGSLKGSKFTKISK